MLHYKHLFSLITLLGLMNCSWAQSVPKFSYGPRVGVNYANMTIEDVQSQINSRKYSAGDAVLGFHAGIFTRFRSQQYAIAPEILFSTTGGNIKVTDASTGQALGDVQQVRFTRLDVPVMLNWFPFGKIARLQAGIVGSYNISSKVNDETIPDAKSFAFGYQAGIGVDISKIFVDLRYEGSLTQFQNDYFQSQGTTFKQNNQQFILSVGYSLR
ncbi:Outer membrane protein beta-barrel domain-containing protein [Flexibacter flexilis DSM 6793]|uniref:Outer membrane protein beta-barrel domain-containing protein n=1 Tax=Flexibacter flexilis DSM 6793 TaxID=927664 RepID=A0A1I1LH95_9BACT|nr:porin family protein [Flexibacter flexilis]SFC68880.1 Outer membrane protein beta-barrel domain-containing protein [Flexibacter flexilis DSM 6793]